MENELLNEKDVEILDSILKTVIVKNTVFPEDLPAIGKTFLSDIKEVKAGDYFYYLDIIVPYNVLDIEFFDRVSFKIHAINIKTKKFYEQGGFKAIYDEQQRVIKRKRENEKMTDEKLKYDLVVSRAQARRVNWSFGLSILSILIAIFSLFIAFLKDK